MTRITACKQCATLRCCLQCSRPPAAHRPHPGPGQSCSGTHHLQQSMWEGMAGQLTASGKWEGTAWGFLTVQSTPNVTPSSVRARRWAGWQVTQQRQLLRSGQPPAQLPAGPDPAIQLHKSNQPTAQHQPVQRPTPWLTAALDLAVQLHERLHGGRGQQRRAAIAQAADGQG